jgi:hypothetical protein
MPDMTKTVKPQFGGLPPKYSFVINPYHDLRFSRCPYCEHKTGQKKIPLLIHIKPVHSIALNYTCRYCPKCDLLIVHKHDLEHLLTEMFRKYNPEAIGNEYLIVGTVEKSAWREGLHHPKAGTEILPHVSDFTEYYKELRVTHRGWFPPGQKPQMMEPLVSQEWVKCKPDKGKSSG